MKPDEHLKKLQQEQQARIRRQQQNWLSNQPGANLAKQSPEASARRAIGNLEADVKRQAHRSQDSAEAGMKQKFSQLMGSDSDNRWIRPCGCIALVALLVFIVLATVACAGYLYLYQF